MHDLVVDGQPGAASTSTPTLDALLRQLTGAGVRSLTSQPPTLEELFLRHYGDRAGAAGPAVAS